MIKFINTNPSNLFNLVNKVIKNLTPILIPILVIGLVQSIFISPADYIQGDSVRIMYVHVPAAWIALASFASIGLFSIINFIFKNKNLLIFNKCIAPIGLMFTIIAIVTGSIWGQPTWGTWWAWDARITSMLILAIFYIFFILSYLILPNYYTLNKVPSIIAIIGLINLPIIKFSVDWWSTLHQPASINIIKKSTIHATMMLPLMLMFIGLVIYSILIFLMKYKSEVIKIKKEGLDRI